MTLKLLLDWAQIIYSMKNIKIYPKDWLQLHPYKQSDPTDSYYTNIANRIYGRNLPYKALCSVMNERQIFRPEITSSK